MMRLSCLSHNMTIEILLVKKYFSQSIKS